jgi:hypothetical protein
MGGGMSRRLERELVAERARTAAIAAYQIGPERWGQIYAVARDWAQVQAEACGEGPLPAWTPRYVDAVARVGGDMPQDAELCVQLAADAWERTRKHWI